MQILYTTLSGATSTLQVMPAEAVHSLKSKIHDKEGIPSCLQRLSFNGHSLDHDSSLSRLSPGSVVHVSLRLCGGAPKKKKKKGGDDNPGELTEQEKDSIFQNQIKFLERELMLKKEEAVEAVHAKNELRERVKEYHDEFEREKMRTLDITADMTRQYKAMHELFITEINQLENQILDLHDQLKLSEMKLERHKAETKTQMEEKDKIIADQHNKMEQMATEFGEMLEATLQKMTDRIQLSSKEYDGEDEQAEEGDEEENKADDM